MGFYPGRVFETSCLPNTLQRYTPHEGDEASDTETCSRSLYVPSVRMKTLLNPASTNCVWYTPRQSLVPFCEVDVVQRCYWLLHRLIDQLYALQLVHRSNGANGYNIGVPVGFEREGQVYVYNHYRIIIYYHANSVSSESPGVRVHAAV